MEILFVRHHFKVSNLGPLHHPRIRSDLVDCPTQLKSAWSDPTHGGKRRLIAPPGWEDKHAREFLLAHQEVRSQGADQIPICEYIEVDDTNTKVINKIIDFICDIISPYFQIHKSRLLLNKGNVHMSCPNLMVVVMVVMMIMMVITL